MDDLIASYEDLTGIRTRHRAWYRALARFKLAVILLVGGGLSPSGPVLGRDDEGRREMFRDVEVLACSLL